MEITLPEIPEVTAELQQLNEQGVFEERHFFLKFNGYTCYLTLQPNTILIQDELRQHKCIDITIEYDCVYLHSYYDKADIKTCTLLLPHSVFFDLLREMGTVYGLSVQLIDMSTKSFEFTDCKIDVEIFAIAGQQTFYERHGFVNHGFRKFIAYISMLRFHEFATEARVSNSDADYLYALKLLNRRGLKPTDRMKRICKNIIDGCKATSAAFTKQSRSLSRHTRTYKKLSTQYEAWMAKYIYDRCNEIHWEKQMYEPRWVLV